MSKIQYPSIEEVNEMKRAARKARAEGLARLAKAALGGIKSLLIHPEAAVRGTRSALILRWKGQCAPSVAAKLR
jgi:hypothetical protein